MTPHDYSALTRRVSRQEVQQFRRKSVGSFFDLSGPTSKKLAPFVSGVFSIAGIALSIVVGIMAIIFILYLISGAGGGSSNPTFVLVFLGLVAGAIIAVSIIASQLKWARMLRISRFAKANGLEFSATGAVPPYPGMIFNTGSARRVPERISQPTAPFFDFGNLTYTTGSNKNKKTHHWSYVALKLDRKLPQIVLDAKSNNFFFSNLPSSFSRNQVLSLEGDFDKYFTLYCPKGYERDALYVLTPDLMTRLIDEAAGFDVEIIDDWLFLYSGKERDLGTASDLAPLFALIDTVGTKTLDRTELYADSNVTEAKMSEGSNSSLSSRMSANRVAPQGRRLRSGIPAVGVIVAIAVAAVFLLNLAPQLMSR